MSAAAFVLSPPPEACWVQAAPKGYPLFIAVLITFIFYLEFFQRANSFFLLLLLFFLDCWRQSSQSCGAASAMLHCTYSNPNRVKTSGYLHASEETFISVQSVCVVHSRQLPDVSISRGQGLRMKKPHFL